MLTPLGEGLVMAELQRTPIEEKDIPVNNRRNTRARLIPDSQFGHEMVYRNELGFQILRMDRN